MYLRFQVICSDKKDFIYEYNNFDFDKMEQMLDYIKRMSKHDIVSRIQIIRWNEKGERG